jgi:cytochrome c biogenesis protein CcmG/thiol:disulfide interchange protein DsbE
VVAATTGSGRTSGPPDTAPPALGAGTPAPGFDLPRLGGGPNVTLAATRGRPVVINFWASWCTDCQAELSAFAAASHRLQGKVTFIGIDTSETDTAAAVSLERHAGVTYATGIAAGETVADAYLVGALPETFFIDASGRVRSFVPGRETLAGLLRAAGGLLKSAS